MHAYKPLEGLGKVVMACLALNIGSEILLTLGSVAFLAIAGGADLETTTDGAALGMGVAVGALALVTLAMLLVTAVVFLMWMYRATANAWALGGQMTRSPGEAVGY